jgi:hypothetical protein
MFSQDFKELLSAFNEHRVKYLIVGSCAVAIHAQPRASKDLGIFIQPGAENAEAVSAALAKFGAPLADLRIDSLTGLKAFVISAEDLIKNKTAFGRPYDLAGASAIRRAAQNSHAGQ